MHVGNETGLDCLDCLIISYDKTVNSVYESYLHSTNRIPVSERPTLNLEILDMELNHLIFGFKL